MNREVHVRNCEGVRVKLPRPFAISRFSLVTYYPPIPCPKKPDPPHAEVSYCYIDRVSGPCECRLNWEPPGKLEVLPEVSGSQSRLRPEVRDQMVQAPETLGSAAVRTQLANPPRRGYRHPEIHPQASDSF
jgi:hypothetical protein